MKWYIFCFSENVYVANRSHKIADVSLDLPLAQTYRVAEGVANTCHVVKPCAHLVHPSVGMD